MSEAPLVRLRVQLTGEAGVESESFWAQPTETTNHYRVENLLVWAPFTYRDVVEAVPTGEGLPQVVRVVSRSNHVTLGIMMEPERGDAQAETWRAVAASYASVLMQAVRDVPDTAVERAGESAFVMQLPARAGIIRGRVDDDALGDYVDALLAHVPSVDNVAITFDVLQSPTMAIGMCEGIDPTIEWVAPSPVPAIEQWFTPAVRFAYEMMPDRPDWLTLEDLLPAIAESYRVDPRVRAAIAADEPADVITLAFRMVAAHRGYPLPPLARPLFEP